jgi:rare lipoprotein A
MAHGRVGTYVVAAVAALWLCPASPARADDVGLASFYGKEHAGKRTASGKRFDFNALTAAHRTLPFGTRVVITNLGNGKSVVVEIADRGPRGRRRIVDVSYAAAQQLGFVREGTAKVRLALQ